MKNRVVVVGLDGASYRMLKEWTKKGDLPYFKKLFQRGSHGILKSTIPPISPTAWASFMTGKNPGSHGILDFLSNGKPENGDNVDGPTIWDILTFNKKKSIIVNVPMTYPPKKTNGVLISGFPLPQGTIYTYPEEVGNRLELMGIYLNDIPTQSPSIDALDDFLVGLYNRMESRFEALDILIKEYEWDLCVVHILETDKIQHDFWKFMYEDSKYKDTILEFYQKIEKRVEELMTGLGSDVYLVIVSDHGFTKSEMIVQLNNWLLKNGYLKLKNTPFIFVKKLLYKVGLTPSFFMKRFAILKKSLLQIEEKKYSKKDKHSIAGKLISFLKDFTISNKDIDWENSIAYSTGNSGLGHINFLVDDEILVNEVKKKLLDIIDGEVKIVDKVHSREELYKGKYSKKASDIVIEFTDYNYTALSSDMLLSFNLIDKNYFSIGESIHHPDGIFLMVGKDVREDYYAEGLDIVDIAPTILGVMGLPIPDAMDGKFIKNIFYSDKKIEFSYNKWEGGQNSQKMTLDQEEKIKEQLRRMGYIG